MICLPGSASADICIRYDFSSKHSRDYGPGTRWGYSSARWSRRHHRRWCWCHRSLITFPHHPHQAPLPSHLLSSFDRSCLCQKHGNKLVYHAQHKPSQLVDLWLIMLVDSGLVVNHAR